jgi:hypothetical protein
LLIQKSRAPWSVKFQNGSQVPHCEGLSPIDGVIPHTFEAFPTWCNQKLRLALSSEAYTSKCPHPMDSIQMPTLQTFAEVVKRLRLKQ